MGKDHRTILELLFWDLFEGVTIGQDVEKETLAISWRRLRLNMGKICEFREIHFIVVPGLGTRIRSI